MNNQIGNNKRQIKVLVTIKRLGLQLLKWVTTAHFLKDEWFYYKMQLSKKKGTVAVVYTLLYIDNVIWAKRKREKFP